MESVLISVVNFGYVALVCSVIALFYLSIKKCFWNGKHKVALFFMSLLFNPFVIMAYALIVAKLIFETQVQLYYVLVLHKKTPIVPVAFVTGFSFVIAFLLLSMLSVWILGKWLRVKKYSPLLFLYIMTGAIYIMEEIRSTGMGDFYNNPFIRYIIEFSGTCVIIVAMWCFYHLDVKPFATLAQLDIKVKWKTFILPPMVFIFFYGIIGTIMEEYDRDEKLILSMYSFSSMIVFLFIWAFNVIVRNISATNEAVMAKDEAIQAKEEVKTLSVEVMEALAHTIDAKDEYTRGHSVRVAKYSRMLAERLGLSAEECENVYYMALLHDIGKIGVPNEIINSPTKLTEEEYDVIKTHPGTGFGILSEIKSRPDLSIGAHWHHERYDGKGYPDGKAGEEIPYYARIIAVADSYDAMTSNRSYRNYLSQDTVRSELEKNSGTQFDSKVAQCMIAIINDDKKYELHE